MKLEAIVWLGAAAVVIVALRSRRRWKRKAETYKGYFTDAAREAEQLRGLRRESRQAEPEVDPRVWMASPGDTGFDPARLATQRLGAAR